MKRIGKQTNKLIVLFSVLILCACNGDEEIVWGQDMNMDAVRGFKATVTINNNVHEIVSPFMAMHTYSICDKFFCISVSIVEEIYIDVYDMPDSGTELNNYISSISYSNMNSDRRVRKYEYVSGSARVTQNDGEYLTMSFSNYKLSYIVYKYSGEEVSHDIVINGNIKFLIEQLNRHSLH